MKKLTRTDLIRSVADRHRTQYAGYPQEHLLADGRSVHNIQMELNALSNSASEEDVAKIVGNKSWTRLNCDECCSEVSEVVIAGRTDPSNYFCRSCIERMMEEINS